MGSSQAEQKYYSSCSAYGIGRPNRRVFPRLLGRLLTGSAAPGRAHVTQGGNCMSKKPRHLMISGCGECDDHRTSARERKEEYFHFQEVSQVEKSLPYDIVYVDSFPAPGPDCRPVDVWSERLDWVDQSARLH